MLAVIFGLKQFAQDGIGWLPVVVDRRSASRSASCSSADNGGWTTRSSTCALFRVPAFSASLRLYGLGILVVFGGFLFLPQYLQLVLGLSPFEAGLWTLPWALAFVVGSHGHADARRSGSPGDVMAGWPRARGPRVRRASRRSTRRPGFAMIVDRVRRFSLGTRRSSR